MADDEDESILKQTNREFEQASPLEQLFHCYLNPVEEEMEGEWLTAMQILSYFRRKHGISWLLVRWDSLDAHFKN